MTNQEKSYFCQLCSSLFSTPERKTFKWLKQGESFFIFEKVKYFLEEKHIFIDFFSEFNKESLFEELEETYDTLSLGIKGKDSKIVSLVESCYKPWTIDSNCPLPFAQAKGLLMGDPALHMLTLYQELGIEISNELKGAPDHITLLLDFLSFLYQEASYHEIKVFIEDHLDWIPILREDCIKANIHPFYISLVEILDLFLKKEKLRLEVF